jgi:hypothetical protein
MQVTVLKRGAAPVDEHSGLTGSHQASTYHIYAHTLPLLMRLFRFSRRKRQSGIVCAMFCRGSVTNGSKIGMLNQTDIGKNANKCVTVESSTLFGVVNARTQILRYTSTPSYWE